MAATRIELQGMLFPFVLVSLSLPLFGQGSTHLISLSSSNQQGDANSGQVAMSPDGRWFAYISSATNLVAGDTNGQDDVFVYDALLGETTRESVSSAGVQGNGRSGNDRVAISNDGRFVVFPSWANNLVPNDTNGHNDLFLRDRWNGTTRRISEGLGGVQGFGNSDDCVMSADANWVACDSDARELWTPDNNFEEDVILFDVLNAVPICVSVNPSGAAGHGESLKPAISPDGRFVAFTSTADDLVPDDTNGTWDTFLRDMTTGQTSRVSVSSIGEQANGSSEFWHVAVSADGRFVAFASNASNLVPDDHNAEWDVFLRDLANGTTTRISVAPGPAESNGPSHWPSLTPDGRFVTFQSEADNLVPNDTNGCIDVFQADTLTGEIRRVSLAAGGAQANDGSTSAVASSDGMLVAFESRATNLYTPDLNGSMDVFVHDRAAACGSFGLYCIAMINSIGSSASIGWYGGSSLSQNDLVLTVDGCPPNKPGLFFFGRFETQIPFGEGYLCTTGSQHRLQPGLRVDANGHGEYLVDFTNPSSAASLIAPGDVWKFQFWYRDPQTVGHGFNLSDALSVTFCP